MTLSSTRRSPSPEHHGQDCAANSRLAGAVAGITSVLLVMLIASEIFFERAARLLPRGVSKVTQSAPTSRRHHVRVVAMRRPHADPGSGRDAEHRDVVRVRRAARGAVRAKSARGAPSLPCRGGRSSPSSGCLVLYLMLSLPVLTWIRFSYGSIRHLIYCFYGRRQALADSSGAAVRSRFESIGNFITSAER